MALLSKNTTIGGKNPLLYKTISNTTVNLNEYHDEGTYIFNNLTSATNFPSQFTWTGKDNSAHLQVISFNKSKQFETIQIIYKNNNNTIYMRYSSSANVWTGWQRIWTAANDGINSGLDADLLDGFHGSQYVRDYGKTYTNFNSLNRNGFYQVSNAVNSPDGSSSLWGCIVFQTDGSTNTTTYLCQIAIKDNTSGKQLYTRKHNGSSWTAWEKIWSSGTDGSGSGLDADTLDGKHANSFALKTELNRNKTYDYVVTSQADFEYLISDTNWHNYNTIYITSNVSMPLNNGRLQICNIPSNIRKICGKPQINENMITINNSFGLNYIDPTNNNGCIIENIKVSCLINSSNIELNNIADDKYYCFNSFTQLYNCIANIQISKHDIDNGWLIYLKTFGGFYNCTNLNCCKCIFKCEYNWGADHISCGFEECNNLYKCSHQFFNLNNYSVTSVGYVDCKDLSYCVVDNTSNKIQLGFANSTGLIYKCEVKSQQSEYGDFTNNDETSNHLYIDCNGEFLSVEKTYNIQDFIFKSNLLTEIKKIDGTNSGIDADLLDSKHAYTFANYGLASASLPTSSLTQTSTGTSSLYRFQDTNNTIGEGTNVYYGIIQIYYSSSYYIRLAISMASGKVYRQTNGATAWNEISVNANPTIPVVTTDPTTIENGQLWIRSDL